MEKAVEKLQKDLSEWLEDLRERVEKGVIAIDGIVVDEELAKATPCKCYAIDEKTEICFSPGIIGSLSKAQRGPPDQPGPYCPTKIHQSSPALESRIKGFKECAVESKGGTIEDYLKKMGSCLAKRGIPVK